MTEYQDVYTIHSISNTSLIVPSTSTSDYGDENFAATSTYLQKRTATLLSSSSQNDDDLVDAPFYNVLTSTRNSTNASIGSIERKIVLDVKMKILHPIDRF